MALSDQEEFELLSLEREKAMGQAAPTAQAPDPSRFSYGQAIKDVGTEALKGWMRGGIAPAGAMAAGQSLTNLDKLAYPAGAAVTDVAAKFASPETAAKLGIATNLGIQSVPVVMGLGASSKAPSGLNAVRQTTLDEARNAGYVVPPSAVGGGMASKALESLGGKAAVGQEAAIRNQKVTNELAKKAASLAEDEPLTEASLKAARDRLSQPYREIRELAESGPLSKPPFKPAGKTLEELQQVRSDATAYWKEHGRTGTVESLKKAQALDQQAERLEQSIEAIATAAGKPDLVARLRAARVALAKNFDVEKALNIGSGDVDAAVIGRILDKKGSNAVTGELGTIGRFAKAFAQFSREAPSGQSAPGVSKLTPYAAALLGVGGYGASEHYGMGPWGAAAAALPILSGPARALALAKAMQGPSRSLSGALTPIEAALIEKFGGSSAPALSPERSGALYR